MDDQNQPPVTPQPPRENKVQVLFARDARGIHSPVIQVTNGVEAMAGRLDPDAAERVAMSLMELAVECRKANSPANPPPEPPGPQAA